MVDEGAFAASLVRGVADGIKGVQKEAEGAPAASGVTEALASAGRVLEGSQAELVLQPLRLAFETKHVKLVEPALDCLHVIDRPSFSWSLLVSLVFACFAACSRLCRSLMRAALSLSAVDIPKRGAVARISHHSILKCLSP